MKLPVLFLDVQVPVGGAVVSGPDSRIVTAVSKLYPGRASVGPILDVFITLLSLVRDLG